MSRTLHALNQPCGWRQPARLYLAHSIIGHDIGAQQSASPARRSAGAKGARLGYVPNIYWAWFPKEAYSFAPRGAVSLSASPARRSAGAKGVRLGYVPKIYWA